MPEVRPRLRINGREFTGRLTVEDQPAGRGQRAAVVVRVADLGISQAIRPSSRLIARSAIDPPPPALPRLKPPPGKPSVAAGPAPRAGGLGVVRGCDGCARCVGCAVRGGCASCAAPAAAKHRAAIDETVLDGHHVKEPRRGMVRRRHPVSGSANGGTGCHTFFVRSVARHELRPAVRTDATRPRQLLHEGTAEQRLPSVRSST